MNCFYRGQNLKNQLQPVRIQIIHLELRNACTVEPRVRNSKMAFCLLLQHCDDKTKESIEHFSEKGDLAYALAKSNLRVNLVDLA